MGWQGITHWSHAHGTPRTFNPASADLYASLYGGEAGQHVVANNDPVPDFIPESDDYVHPLSGLYIWGTNSTYGMNWRTCFQDAEDPACQGDASAPLDHYYYYTPVGQCGQRPYYTQNDTIASAFVDSQSQSYYATATASIPSNFDDDDEQTSTSTATSTSASTSADENNEDSSALVAAEASQHQGNDDSSASPLHLAFSSIATALIVLSVTNF